MNSSLAAIGLAALALAPQEGGASSAPRAQLVERAERPKLAVLLVIDQLIPENLRRLEPVLEGGLGRLLREGLVFERAQLAHGLSYTAPGHFSAGSGVVPYRHGVVANGWRDAEALKSVYCTEDEDVRRVDNEGVDEDSPGQRRSPKLSQVPGIADFFEEAFADQPGGARTISISGKDRAAIGTAGQHPDLALWWDKDEAAGFCTSSWYTSELPDWVRGWNAGWLAGASGAEWPALAPELLERVARLGTAADEREGEYKAFGGKRALPYVLPDVDAPKEGDEELDAAELAKRRRKRAQRLAGKIYTSPWIDRFVLELAREAVDHWNLGADEATDVLCLSLTAVDTVGHLFGPSSVEVTDVLLRMDRELARLFAHLDERVGEGEWVLALTSDHGVLELPEELQARGLRAGRVPRSKLNASDKALAAALEEEYGMELFWRRDSSGVYFDRPAAREAGVDLSQARAFARDFLLERAGEIWHYGLTLGEAEQAAIHLFDDPKGYERLFYDPWQQLLAASYFPGRSPDVFLMGPPWFLLGDVGGTTHGTPYPYDRRIPLLFYGPGVEPAVRYDAAHSIDVVPTLLEACGIEAGRRFDGVSRWLGEKSR